MRSNPRAKTSLIRIRRIFAPFLSTQMQIIAQLLATNMEERADNCASARRINNRIDAGQAGQSGSADDVSENSLRLVVCGVGNRNACRFLTGQDALEKSVAQMPRGLFNVACVQRRCCSHVFACAHKFQPACPRQFLDEVSIMIRVCASEHMVEMNHEQRNSEFVSK